MKKMKCINEMKLQFISRSANEGFARVAVASFAAQLDPTLDELSELKTAVSEAVTNAIVHGYKNGFGIVYINAKIYDEGVISIIIRDKGCGIESIEKAMEPLYTSSDSGDRAGMGFTIMQSFMDKLRVNSSMDKGTRIFMQKKLTVKA
jgi:stage II sporulation protein AB (anti-sigma F factor)